MVALGWILDTLYRLVDNYGVAIILFTVLIKAVLLPLDIKQKKSIAKTQKIQPLLMEVQKKYANDKDKLSQETMKIYQKYGINPMGGCLPMLLQFPIIIALYWVVKKPIMYMMGIGEADTWRIAEAFNQWAAANGGLIPEGLKNIIPVTYEKAMTHNTFGTYEISIAQQLFKHPEILQHPYISNWGETVRLIDFDFFGLDLSEIPNFGAFLGIFMGRTADVTLSMALLWIIPILSGLSSFLASKVAMAQQGGEKKDKYAVVAEADKKEENSTASTMKTMNLMMPLFSAWFAFTLPAAVGLYWIISNVIQIIQQIVVTKYFVTDISDDVLEGDIANVKKGRKNRKKSR